MGIEVWGRQIGPGQPAFVVAEVGINHNGDADIALRLIHEAKQAGADAVKFQVRSPKHSVPRHMWDTRRQTPWGEMTYIDYKERIELAEYEPIKKQSSWSGIPWFASAWDAPSVEYLESLDVPLHKVPSACLTDNELIVAMARTGKPIVLSTGMSTETEILDAVALLERHSNGYIICHCNSSYPAPVVDLNLRRIYTLHNMFPGVPIGYSGHEVGLATTGAAVAMGACYIERHITLDRSMWGTDQAASVEPDGFRHLVHDIRNIEKAMGDGGFVLTALEEQKRYQLRGLDGEGQPRSKAATTV